MSSNQFAEQRAFADLEPFGTRYEDERFGRLAALLANINRASGHEPYTWEDFYPAHWVNPKSLLPHVKEAAEKERLATKFMAWAESFKTQSSGAEEPQPGAPTSILRPKKPR